VKKHIHIKEFREAGYLQELNRRFLHPLGLALEVSIDPETGDETLGGVWDYRKDPLGIIFDEKTLAKHLDILQHRAKFVEQQRQIKIAARTKKYGWSVQPLKPAK